MINPFSQARFDGAYMIYNDSKIKNIDDCLILELNEYQSPPQQQPQQTNNKPSFVDKCKYDILMMILWLYYPICPINT